MGELGVDFVDEVGEVREGFVVDAFEEHYGGEVLLEVLHFVGGDLFLQD